MPEPTTAPGTGRGLKDAFVASTSAHYATALQELASEQTICWNAPVRAARVALAVAGRQLEDAGSRSEDGALAYVVAVARDVLQPFAEQIGAWTQAGALVEQLSRTDALVIATASQFIVSDPGGTSRLDLAVESITTGLANDLAAVRRPTLEAAAGAWTRELNTLQAACGNWWIDALETARASSPEARNEILLKSHRALANAFDHALEPEVRPLLEVAQVEAWLQPIGQRVQEEASRGARLARTLQAMVRRSVQALNSGKRGRVLDEGWLRIQHLLAQRLRLTKDLLLFSARVQELADSYSRDMIADALRETVNSVADAEARLRTIHNEAEALGAGGGAPSAADVRRWLGLGRQAIEESRARLSAEPAIERLLTASEQIVQDITSAVGALPAEASVAPALEEPADRWPSQKPVGLTPREWAQRSFSTPRLEAIRTAAAVVVDRLGGAEAVLEKAGTVLAYNLEAAVDELRSGSRSSGAPSGRGITTDLVLGGLERTADHFARLLEELAEGAGALRYIVAEELGTGLFSFAERVNEADDWSAALADHWRDVRARVGGAARLIQSEGGQAAGWARKRIAAAVMRAEGLLRRSRKALGLAAPVASGESLQELRLIDTRAANLPFVYRRLFANLPIEDPSLLAGREADLAVLEQHHEDWLGGRTNALLVAGPFGSGLRSLMNVFAQRLHPAPLVRLVIPGRITSEQEFVTLAAPLLLEGDAKEVESLDELAALIQEQGIQRICHMERLEHLFFRSVETRGLFPRVLEFFSYTDREISWFATVSSDAWYTMRRIAPAAAALVHTHALQPLDADGTRSMLLARHQRSGLVLEYDTTQAPSAVLKRQGRATDKKARREELERSYFEQIASLSDGSVPLALLYWLRSVRFAPESETVHLEWPQPLDFGFIEALAWDHVFTLKSLLEHATLTVAEHAEIFGSTERHSHDVMEGLGNLLLLEPVGEVRRVGEPLQFSSIDLGQRYQIRPALVASVRRVLLARHLVE